MKIKCFDNLGLVGELVNLTPTYSFMAKPSIDLWLP